MCSPDLKAPVKPPEWLYGTWLGAFLVHCIMIPGWTCSPLPPLFAVGCLWRGGWWAAVGVAVLSVLAYVNWGTRFQYRPHLLKLVYDLDMSKYYQQCELRGALNEIGESDSLFLFHPHGVLSIGFVVNGVWSRPFHLHASRTAEKLASVGRWTGTVFLIAPALREVSGFFKWLCDVSGRLESASKRNIVKLMGERRNVGIIPGGFQDATLFERGKERTCMRERKGLIKYALQHGYKVHPIYTFGESDSYSTFTGLLKFRLWLNSFDVPAVFFFGNPWLPLFPRTSTRALTYVGSPLQLPHIAEPTAQQVDEWHGRYLTALTELFDTNKVAAGKPDATLEIY